MRQRKPVPCEVCGNQLTKERYTLNLNNGEHRLIVCAPCGKLAKLSPSQRRLLLEQEKAKLSPSQRDLLLERRKNKLLN